MTLGVVRARALEMFTHSRFRLPFSNTHTQKISSNRGWETVKAYERSSLADDEEEDRKIKNAVATAKRKLREKSESAAKKRRPNWQRSASGQTNPTNIPSQDLSAPHFAPAPIRSCVCIFKANKPQSQQLVCFNPRVIMFEYG